MSRKGSAYGKFVRSHRDFQAKYPETKERQRKRPWRFIEEVGLECAVWPHLYWKTSMTESYARSTDERRLARTGRKQARFVKRAEAADIAESGEDASSESSNDEQNQRCASEDSEIDDNQDIDYDDDDFVDEGRRSAKGSFMAKVLSPVIGYGNDFELLQYVYDLNMWSSLGGKKNACKDTPLRDARLHMFFSHRAPALAMARSRQSKIPYRCVALFRMASARRFQTRDVSGP